MPALLLAEMDATRMGQAFGYLLVYIPLFAVVAFFGASIARLFTPGRSAAWVVGAILSGIVTLGILFSAALLTLQKLGGSGASAGSSLPAKGESKRIVSADKEFSIILPTNWREDPDLAKGIPLGASNKAQERYLLISTTPKTDFEGSLDDFAAMGAKQVMGRLEGAEMMALGEHSIGGCPAIHKRFEGKTSDVNVVYYNAYIETKTSFHVVVTWTLKSRDEASAPILREVTDSLEFQAGPPVNTAVSPAGKTDQK